MSTVFMHISGYFLIIALEAFIVLLLICTFLGFYARSQRAVVKRLQARLMLIAEQAQHAANGRTAMPLTPTPPANNEATLEQELATYKKRVANLEKFRELFFSMEQQWEEAKKLAHGYYEQLVQLAEGMEDKTEFNVVLESYHGAYRALDLNMEQMRQLDTGAPPPKTVYKTIEIDRTSTNTLKDLKRLRTISANQNRVINDLEHQLSQSSTAEERAKVVKNLQQQLQQQIRFVDEAETCIELLESELSSALHRIGQLEQENTTPDPEQNAALAAEHLALQSRYAELEEKYLDLKMAR